MCFPKFQMTSPIYPQLLELPRCTMHRAAALLTPLVLGEDGFSPCLAKNPPRGSIEKRKKSMEENVMESAVKIYQ